MLQMYTTWLDALEEGDMAGVCMIDMSAAFDVVDTEVLLEKLKLYGFDRNSIQWIWSYLTYRSQAVYIVSPISYLLKLVYHRVPYLGQFFIPSSQMSYHRWCMR